MTYRSIQRLFITMHGYNRHTDVLTDYVKR